MTPRSWHRLAWSCYGLGLALLIAPLVAILWLGWSWWWLPVGVCVSLCFRILGEWPHAWGDDLAEQQALDADEFHPRMGDDS